MEPISAPRGRRRPPTARRLESWKEIATYLRRDVTTVQRWEKREGLPVHRHQHDRQGTVFAYATSSTPGSAGGNSGPTKRRAPSRRPNRRPRQPRPGLGRRALGGLAIAAAVLVAAAGAVVTVNRQVVRGSPQALQARFTIVPPPLNTFNHVAISGDGRAIIYATGPLLHLRRLDAVQPQPLPETAGRVRPVFLARRPVVRLLRRQRAEEDARHRRTRPRRWRRRAARWARRGAPAATSSLRPSAAPPSRGSPRPAATRW